MNYRVNYDRLYNEIVYIINNNRVVSFSNSVSKYLKKLDELENDVDSSDLSDSKEIIKKIMEKK